MCTNGSGVGKCGDGNSNYFAINLHTIVMAVAIMAPTAEAAALAVPAGVFANRIAMTGTLQ
jgi:hypothetical protein